jgi:outer membrane protein TolC
VRRSFLFLVSLANLLVVGAPASAEPVRPSRAVTLHEVVELAVRQNPTLASAGAEIASADGLVTAARGLDDPVLDGSATWTQNRRALVGGTPVQQPSLDDVSAALSVTQPLPTGGKIGLRAASAYDRTEFAVLNAADPNRFDRQSAEVYAPSLQLTFQHALLRGLGVSYARADRRRASARHDLATVQRDATVAALLRDVVSAYWEVTYATGELEIRRFSADAARYQLKRVGADIGVGKQPPSACAEVEVAIARRDELVLLAEQAVVERSLDLERLIGQPIDRQSATLMAADPLSTLDPTPPLDRTLEAALDHNPQLLAAQAQERSLAIEVDVTQNGLLPQLDLLISGGPGGFSADAARSFTDLSTFRTYSVSAGLVFQEPLGHRAARGANESARATLRRAELDETDIRLQISSAVVRGLTAVEAARRRAEVLSRSVEAADLDLAAEKARFETGRSSNFDVLRRQDSLAQVKLSALRARVDYIRALAIVESLTGAIADKLGVRFR